jgi:hypothetical protein
LETFSSGILATFGDLFPVVLFLLEEKTTQKTRKRTSLHIILPSYQYQPMNGRHLLLLFLVEYNIGSPSNFQHYNCSSYKPSTIALGSRKLMRKQKENRRRTNKK